MIIVLLAKQSLPPSREAPPLPTSFLSLQSQTSFPSLRKTLNLEPSLPHTNEDSSIVIHLSLLERLPLLYPRTLSRSRNVSELNWTRIPCITFPSPLPTTTATIARLHVVATPPKRSAPSFRVDCRRIAEQLELPDQAMPYQMLAVVANHDLYLVWAQLESLPYHFLDTDKPPHRLRLLDVVLLAFIVQPFLPTPHYGRTKTTLAFCVMKPPRSS